MRRSIKVYARQFYRKCCFNFTLFCFTICLIIIVFHKSSEFNSANFFKYYKEPVSFFDGPPKNIEGIKIDWHDYKQISDDAARIGLGEQGRVAKLNDTFDEEYVSRTFKMNGYDGVLSDQISLNRSLSDVRHKNCKTIKYLSELPTVSVIIPFYDEHFSVLMRNVYSIINRSPTKLLKEIIIVDDGSEKGIILQFFSLPFKNIKLFQRL